MSKVLVTWRWRRHNSETRVRIKLHGATPHTM